MKTFQACIAWGQIRGREDYMDNTLLRIENKAKDTVKLISLLRNNGVDVAEVEEAIQLVMQKYIQFFLILCFKAYLLQAVDLVLIRYLMKIY